jgi:hypothetical protein
MAGAMRTTAQDPPRESPPPIYWFVRYGQSLSVGYLGFCGTTGTPPCSTGLPGNVMLWSRIFPPAGAFQPLAERIYQNSPPAVESSATSMCNEYTILSGRLCGTANYGWPGASHASLAKSSAFCAHPCFFDYAVGLNYGGGGGPAPLTPTGTGVLQAYQNARERGIPFYVPGVYYNQGETEMNGSTSAETYKGYVTQLQADFQGAINEAIGQSGLVPLFLAQKSSWTVVAPNRATPTTTTGGDGVALGQLQAALEHYSDGTIWLIGPEYPNMYNRSVHMTAADYRASGGREGKVLDRVTAEGKPWRPFYPRRISISGRVMTVRFWVPYPPLIFEEAMVAPLPDGNKGFELTDTGGSGVTIESVSLTPETSDSITIMLSAEPAGSVELRYAWTAAGVGPEYIGAKSGPRGNVADSDGRLSWSGDSLRDYAVTFRIRNLSAAAPYVWEPPDPTNLGTIAGAKGRVPAVIRGPRRRK